MVDSAHEDADGKAEAEKEQEIADLSKQAKGKNCTYQASSEIGEGEKKKIASRFFACLWVSQY